MYSLMFTSVKSQSHLSGRRETTFLTSSWEAQNPENMEKGRMLQIQDTSSLLSGGSGLLKTACCSSYCSIGTEYHPWRLVPYILWLGFKTCDWKSLSVVHSLLECTSAHQEKTKAEVCSRKPEKVKTIQLVATVLTSSLHFCCASLVLGPYLKWSLHSDKACGGNKFLQVWGVAPLQPLRGEKGVEEIRLFLKTTRWFLGLLSARKTTLAVPLCFRLC